MHCSRHRDSSMIVSYEIRKFNLIRSAPQLILPPSPQRPPLYNEYAIQFRVAAYTRDAFASICNSIAQRKSFSATVDVDVAKLWAQAMTPLCPSLQYSFSQSYQIQLPTKPHFGFRFL